MEDKYEFTYRELDKEACAKITPIVYRYQIDILPFQPGGMVVHFNKYPPLWWRITTRIFFGWKVTKI